MIRLDNSSNRRPDQYWATLPPAKLADEMTLRINRFSDHADSYALWERWRRMLRLSYGFDPDGNGLTWKPVITGSAGQIVKVRLNALLRYKRAAHVMVIAQRPAPQARPSAYDSSATESVPVANALCDQQIGKGGGERSMQLANWYAQDFGSGWVSARWDELAGRKVPVPAPQMPDDGAMQLEAGEGPGPDETPVHELAEAPAMEASEVAEPKLAPEGDVIIQTHRPDCVVFDISLDETGRHQWLMLATQRNRYELAQELQERLALAQDTNPERMRSHVLTAVSTTKLDQQRMALLRSQYGDDWTQNADLVWVYELFHVATPLMPEGRYAMMLDGQILSDGPNLYSELPIYEHCALRISGTKWGYSHFFDLMGPQQVADAHITAATTTAENCGIPGVWIQPGGDQGSNAQVVGGMRIIKSLAEPKPIEFSGDAPMKLTQSHAYMLEQMKALSGITDAALGDTSSANSGKQAAMAQAAAMQNVTDYSSSYVSCYEAVFNGVIKRYRAFSTTTRIVQIAGRGRKWQAKRFTAKTLEGVDAIDVQMGASIMRTTAGVVDTANMLLEAQMISREEYMAMITNGRLEPAFDGPQRHEALIERENEMLMDGEIPEVAPTDNPIEHILRHRSVLDDPDTRKDDAVVNAVMEHLDAHDVTWLQASLEKPALLQALGIPLHPNAQMMMAAQATQAQAAAQQPPQGDPNAPAALPAEANPAPAPQAPAALSASPTGGGVAPTGEELPEVTA